MKRCEVCGHHSERAFTVTLDGKEHTFDSFECAIQALAPQCPHCGCRVIGHGEERGATVFCCNHCAEAHEEEVVVATAWQEEQRSHNGSLVSVLRFRD